MDISCYNAKISSVCLISGLSRRTIARVPEPQVTARHDATPSQVALAWLLGHSPAVLPIPGTSSVAHLEGNERGGSHLGAHGRGDRDAGEKLTGDEPWTLG